jgi:hypothetical protein
LIEARSKEAVAAGDLRRAAAELERSVGGRLPADDHAKTSPPTP